MLIVIVIIGILAAALIPRLSSARGRANDVARKADLAQVAAAIVAYQIDHGKLPDCPWSVDYCALSSISTGLIQAWMSSIPTDPDKNRIITPGIDGLTPAAWQYIYTTIYKSSIPNNGFVIMAATETEWWSNRDTDISEILEGSYTSYETISAAMCKEFWVTPSCANSANTDDLRYIYLY